MTRAPRKRFLPLKAVHHLILLLLEERPTYGVDLLERLEKESGGLVRLNAGSLYRTIARLVDSGLIVPVEDPAVPSVGAPRKLYRVTAVGRDLLRAESRRQAKLLELAGRLKLLGGQR
jgi:DNA-binding PadR family transcriptional regulator